MAHGRPDWGLTSATKITYPITDLGEHAARMGSIVTFDRRGDVKFLDDWRDGLDKWHFYSVVAAGTHRLTTLGMRSGPYSLYMYPGVASGAQHIAELSLPYTTTTRIGLEFSIALNTLSAPAWAKLRPQSTLLGYEWGLRYNTLSNTLQYLDSTNNWATLDETLGLVDAYWNFHTLKIVGDLETGNYVRALVDGNPYDMSAIAGRSLGVWSSNRILLQLGVDYDIDSDLATLFDDIIVTQNEP